MANSVRLYRSKQSEALDARFSGSPEELRVIYQTALDLYAEYESRALSDLVNDLAALPGLPWNDGTATEFGSERWSTGRDAVLKHGYREAFQLALAHDPPVPVETFWVSGAGDEFEVHISDGFARVTVFMLVPPGDGVLHSSERAHNKAWVVTAGGRNADDGRSVAVLVPESIVKIEVSGKRD